MSGGGGGSGQPMTFPQWDGTGAPPYPAYPSSSLSARLKSHQGMKSPMELGQDGGVTGPDGEPIEPPGGGGTGGGATGGGSSGGGGSQYASLGIPYGMPFLGVPFNQYAGGPQASPFANLGDQILNARQIMHGGAGRFGANNAARFGFAGGSFWRPDNLNYGPAPQSPYQPQRPLTPPQQFTQPGGPQPGGPPAGTPGLPPSMPPATGSAGQHMQNLQALMKENPALAYQYTNLDPSVSQWFFKNQKGIQDSMFGGDINKYNQWINQYGGQGNTSAGAEQTNRIRAMAGLKPIDAWRFGGAQPSGPAPSGPRPQSSPTAGLGLPPGIDWAALQGTPMSGAQIMALAQPGGLLSQPGAMRTY